MSYFSVCKLDCIFFSALIYLIILVIIGQSVELYPQNNVAENGDSAPRHLTFIVGDKVKVLMSVDSLKTMQEGHGGWNPRMEEVCHTSFCSEKFIYEPVKKIMQVFI